MRAISKDNEKMFNPRSGKPFTSPKYKQFEQQVKFFAMAQYKGELLSGPLEVDFRFYFMSKTHCDLFNLPKSIADALEDVVYLNDRQIKKGSVMLIDGKAASDRFEVDIREI